MSHVDMTDPAARLALYDQIYRAGKPIHPKKGKLELYGSHTNRDEPFLKWIGEHLPVPEFPIGPPRVLDASCGRGHLARALLKRGYDVAATEVSPWLVEQLKPEISKIQLLAYAELCLLEPRYYDAVISNDVLEHLPEQEAIEALVALAKLTRRWLLVSVGIGFGALKYTHAIGMPGLDLHLFCPGWKRWLKEFGYVGRVVERIVRPRKTLWALIEVTS